MILDIVISSNYSGSGHGFPADARKSPCCSHRDGERGREGARRSKRDVPAAVRHGRGAAGRERGGFGEAREGLPGRQLQPLWWWQLRRALQPAQIQPQRGGTACGWGYVAGRRHRGRGKIAWGGLARGGGGGAESRLVGSNSGGCI